MNDDSDPLNLFEPVEAEKEETQPSRLDLVQRTQWEFKTFAWRAGVLRPPERLPMIPLKTLQELGSKGWQMGGVVEIEKGLFQFFFQRPREGT